MRPAADAPPSHESPAGAFGIPELMPPNRRRDFHSNRLDAGKEMEKGQNMHCVFRENGVRCKKQKNRNKVKEDSNNVYGK